ncbi:DegT/DnrJ/EryC1/StrS family aminotransferase [Gammaproteobacteria bacterium]|nr:DegT/DnrJ/EryC1/StrS family aminotransferase [Gammaproteobacteria bacterium]MDA8798625.1 DegT/DnrJ/EryC1/StrS family aminotransferase [Gammaproteobacteria bacterium]MDC0919309.1 DegT/DnrJ/EryC1/StrS family aminotransferase [Gammaproteobacteria bacterium]
MKNIPFVDLKSQYLSIKPEIDNAIKKIIESTSFIGGAELDKFSEALSTLLNIKHSVTVANGTDAIYIALKMLGIGEGDEVITTAHSWISTSETISQTGAKPIFVDTNEFFCINTDLIESRINKNTKAIIPVHLYGNSCEMSKINQLAKKYNLFVVEDCAQAILTKYKNKYVGTMGDAGTISFFPGKNLGAYGDAGAIITNKSMLAKRMKMFANHGGLVKHQHEIEGINSRMDSLQAAILNVKIKYIKTWISKRRQAADMYNYYLKDLHEVSLPLVQPHAKHSYHLYVIKTKKRKALSDFLKLKKISTGIHYPSPLPALRCYRSQQIDLSEFPNSIKDAKEILSLPIFPEINEKQIQFIANAMKGFYSKYNS